MVDEERFFEWDEAKSRRNLVERGFDFEFATRVFDGPVVEEEDRRRDYRERRMIATGRIEGGFFVVVYTWRGRKRRIISARSASRREQNEYREAFPE